ncbi:hypothetical protein NRC1 [Methanocella arvoryzae MRE50]|uniref:Uncharacterized protein n=1 Tax=Methanocella arvoryzae (strain DSM 22066 / NBRC 105507 / MRE50) TaxID=351160 RepID=Q0W045_METAR|nr:hypothetical protein NRC1 [Methanocella arvoryzae MRE50]
MRFDAVGLEQIIDPLAAFGGYGFAIDVGEPGAGSLEGLGKGLLGQQGNRVVSDDVAESDVRLQCKSSLPGSVVVAPDTHVYRRIRVFTNSHNRPGDHLACSGVPPLLFCAADLDVDRRREEIGRPVVSGFVGNAIAGDRGAETFQQGLRNPGRRSRQFLRPAPELRLAEVAGMVDCERLSPVFAPVLGGKDDDLRLMPRGFKGPVYSILENVVIVDLDHLKAALPEDPEPAVRVGLLPETELEQAVPDSDAGKVSSGDDDGIARHWNNHSRHP